MTELVLNRRQDLLIEAPEQADRHILFAVAYEHDFTLIGNTDMEYRTDPATAPTVADETGYLCEGINGYFK